MLYLIPFLHQTTTIGMQSFSGSRCILFHFYIKPQQRSSQSKSLWVVSYSISTSNHNHYPYGCYSSAVVSYSISTSNHNDEGVSCFGYLLYLIPFLHQTTT